MKIGMSMKLDLTKALDIQKALRSERLKNQVDLVGIELEGGWARVKAGANIQRDGSVVFSDFIPDLRAVGELPSPPITVREFPNWMKVYYPKYVNPTCGMHVHMSFKTALMYSRLMEESYPATIIIDFIRWAEEEKLPPDHPIWDRLKGRSKYAQFLFFPDEQAKTAGKDYDQHRPGHRYTVVNYCHQRNGTLECRLLPMMETAQQGIKTVQHLLDVTNAYLVTNRKREEKVKAEWKVDEEVAAEERRSYV